MCVLVSETMAERDSLPCNNAATIYLYILNKHTRYIRFLLCNIENDGQIHTSIVNKIKVKEKQHMMLYSDKYNFI